MLPGNTIPNHKYLMKFKGGIFIDTCEYKGWLESQLRLGWPNLSKKKIQYYALFEKVMSWPS